MSYYKYYKEHPSYGITIKTSPPMAEMFLYPGGAFVAVYFTTPTVIPTSKIGILQVYTVKSVGVVSYNEYHEKPVSCTLGPPTGSSNVRCKRVGTRLL